MNREELLARAQRPGEEALRLHPFCRGKVQTPPTVLIRDAGDRATGYSPGVAACRAIERQPDPVWEHAKRANSVALVSDGARELLAALVREGLIPAPPEAVAQ